MPFGPTRHRIHTVHQESMARIVGPNFQVYPSPRSSAEIRYMPGKLCLELKSLKEDLLHDRSMGIFQENIVNQVLEDVARACKPKWAVVKGVFRPRGGIGTTVEARGPRPKK